jgi:hypothetical protein
MLYRNRKSATRLETFIVSFWHKPLWGSRLTSWEGAPSSVVDPMDRFLLVFGKYQEIIRNGVAEVYNFGLLNGEMLTQDLDN